MKSALPPVPGTAVALMTILGAAVNGLGFVASDLELTKVAGGLGFLTPLLLVGPLGIGLVAVGLLEAAAALTLFGGATMLLLRRRAGIWVTMIACAPGLLSGLLLVCGLVPATLVFGKTMAGLPTQSVAWAIVACTLGVLTTAVALAVSQHGCAGQASPSRPCSIA
ncbi:hypothetical protein A5647_00565 [Mycobacterium sp. 1100029.7]|nr:hypothetical protein A5647_00565 [Mycobacterium sp. 1100029.7]